MSIDSWDDIPVVVIDNGSGVLKAGLAGDDCPRIFSSVVGRLRNEDDILERQQDTYIGNEAQSRREILSMRWPIEHGIITDWQDMERIWQYAFDEVGVSPEDHTVLLTEVPLNPKVNREKMAQVMFETFNSTLLNVSIPSLLTIFSAGGRTTGVVLDSGDGVTHVVPVYEGFASPSAIVRLDFAGRDVTENLMRMLGERGYSFATTSDREIVREIKEKCCYVASNPEEEIQIGSAGAGKTYKLPDDQIITLDKETLESPEILFEPSMYGVKCCSIHKAIHDCIMSCDVDLRKVLYSNIILSGGTSMLTGLVDRVKTEMTKMAPQSLRTRIIVPPEREYAAWVGGSVLAGLSTFLDEMLISRQEYEECGPSILHKKFSQGAIMLETLHF